jgi:glycosyltransferase involved in cell wall biosynthesis
VVNLVNWDKLIVDIEDPWLSLPRKKVTTDCLRVLFRRADLVCANGSKVALEYAEIAGKEVHNLHNGIDPAFAARLLTRGACPAFFHGIPEEKRVVYTGQVDGRLDLALLHDLAERFTQFTFFFVGIERFFHEKAEQWNYIRQLPNVRAVLPVPYAEIPDILAHSGALIIPYSHEGASTMFPAKLLEYLAAGKVVLTSVNYSSDLPALDSLAGIRVCESPEAWGAALADVERGSLLVSVTEEAERARVVQENLWESKARRLIGLVVAADTVSSKAC